MDLDNIIYIVATIVIFIVSLLGQKKKKVEAPVAKQEEEAIYSLNDFEKILERKQEFRQTEEVAQAEEMNAHPAHEEVSNEHSHKEEKLKMEHKAPKHHEEKRDLDENDDGFDVKSAVIYSSILERKKFRH